MVYYDSWTTLRELRHGALFETLDGDRAVKTEYHTFNDCTQCDCYLLASGEAAHFARLDSEIVREIILSGPSADCP